MKKIGLLAIFLLAGAAFATDVNLVNASVSQQRAVSGNLGGQVNDILENGGWAAWSVPMVAGQNWGCFNEKGDRCSCSLESNDHKRFTGMTSEVEADTLTIFLRAENGEINRLELISNHCEIDGGGAAVTLIQQVDPADSIEFLSSLSGRSIMNHVLAAVALHHHDQADAALQNFVGDHFSMDVRRNAVFWMGQARGQAGFNMLEELANNEPSVQLREHVTFGLHTSDVPQSRAALMTMAREDRSSQVRHQAIFWLANEGGDEVIELIMEQLNESGKGDMDRLVFALTQFPDNSGMKHLVDMARNHGNGEIRGKALFWLGQEEHPAVFEIIDAALENETGEELVEKAIFTLSQISGKDALDRLLDLARNHPSSHVRGKSLFWLGQQAGEKAEEALMEAVEEDPDLEVKEQAVFALSQLPKEEAGKRLTHLARNHKHPEIRKKALFWLGQIGYDGAVDLFEEILTRD